MIRLQIQLFGLIVAPEELPVLEVPQQRGLARVHGRGDALGVHIVDLLVGVAEEGEHLAAVFAEGRRGGDDLRGVFLELVRDADALHLAVDAVGPGRDVVTGGVLCAFFDVRRTEGLLVRDAGLVHDGLDLVDRALGAEFRDGGLDALTARQGLE